MSFACGITADLFNQFIHSSKDGYGIFDKDDRLIFSNYTFRDIFCLENHPGLTCDFEHLVKHAFMHKRGINIEAENIEDWLAYVSTVRRKREFRTFEVDLVDGRWMLFSEQMLPSGELLVQTKDITRQKVVESKLKDSVNQLHKLALTDELTQLANRRCFVDSVESELSRCKRSESQVTMMVIDLDFFKIVNDTYGHHAGDAALVHCADVLKEALRQYDIVGRIGGEEFAIFLGNTDIHIAQVIAERIRSMLENSPLNYQGKAIVVTASIGLASRECTVSFEELYTEADEALYAAKAKGRNRVALYHDELHQQMKDLAG